MKGTVSPHSSCLLVAELQPLASMQVPPRLRVQAVMTRSMKGEYLWSVLTDVHCGWLREQGLQLRSWHPTCGNALELTWHVPGCLTGPCCSETNAGGEPSDQGAVSSPGTPEGTALCLERSSSLPGQHGSAVSSPGTLLASSGQTGKQLACTHPPFPKRGCHQTSRHCRVHLHLPCPNRRGASKKRSRRMERCASDSSIQRPQHCFSTPPDPAPSFDDMYFIFAPLPS